MYVFKNSKCKHKLLFLIIAINRLTALKENNKVSIHEETELSQTDQSSSQEAL